jgi:hypothetical protein
MHFRMFRRGLLMRRVNFEESSKGLKIIVSKRWDALRQEVNFVWWVLLGVAFLIRAVWVRQSSENWIGTIRMWAFLFPSCCVFFAVAVQYFKAAFEKDVVTVHESHFSLHRNFLWWQWKFSAPAKDVSNLRINTNWLGLVQNIAFDCGGRTYTFGNRVLQDEAQQILVQLGKHLRYRC